VTCMQMYVYFMQGFKDNVWFKSTVSSLGLRDFNVSDQAVTVIVALRQITFLWCVAHCNFSIRSVSTDCQGSRYIRRYAKWPLPLLLPGDELLESNCSFAARLECDCEFF
jgi:hypothetical protein